MPLHDWIDIDTLQAVSRHTSAVLVVILGFVVVGVVIRVGLHDGRIKQILEGVDGFILVGLFLVLAWKLFDVLIRGKRNGSHCVVVA